MLHFPVHELSPGLLADPTPTTSTLNHLKRRQIARLVVQGDEAPRTQQLHHIWFGWQLVGHDLKKRVG